MTATERVLAHFERISEAPGAIRALRRFILALAARGRIVSQDPLEEPAEQLLHERVLGLTPAAEPWPLPKGWAWSSLRLLGESCGGGTPSKAIADYWVGTIPWVSPKDMKVDFITDSEDHISESAVQESAARFVPPGSLVMVVRGMILAHSFPSALTKVRVTLNQDMKALVPFRSDVAPMLLLLTKGMQNEFLSLVQRSTHGTCRLVTEDVFSLPLPIPPLAEQHRILAEVDQLMSLCGRLEEEQKERDSRRDRLVSASLARLNQPLDPSDFREHVRFQLDHLPRTMTSRKHIEQLRRAILNLAVRGRLVPQDKEDGPASELLAKKMLLPDGTQRRRKVLKKTSALASAELFPTIPPTWEYATIQNLYELNVIIDYADGNHGSLYPRSAEFGDSGVTFVTARDMARGRVAWHTCAKLNETRASQLTKGWAKGGDVLLTHNATVGRVARVEPDVGRFLLGTSVTFYRLNADVLDPDFFFRVLESPLWQVQLEAVMAQTTRNQVSIQKQAFFRVVVPPIGEQRRIVSKVDELMDVCDRLEAQFEAGRVARATLLDASLRDALASRELAPSVGAQ